MGAAMRPFAIRGYRKRAKYNRGCCLSKKEGRGKRSETQPVESLFSNSLRRDPTTHQDFPAVSLTIPAAIKTLMSMLRCPSPEANEAALLALLKLVVMDETLEMAEECSDGDDDKTIICKIRKRVLKKMTMFRSIVQEWGFELPTGNISDRAMIKYTDFLLATASGKAVGERFPGKLATPFKKTKLSAYALAAMVESAVVSEESFDATRWIDRHLIRLCSKFGDYRKDDPSSFSLNPGFSLLPQFMFNIRRSQFVQVFNDSVDETAYFRMMLNRESISNATVMIQPSLISYSFNSFPSPTLLDVASISAGRILLLDSYFSVVVFHGMTISQRRNNGYQHQPEHQAFAQLLQAPHDDAELIIRERFPVPRLVVCDQHGCQVRFLLAKLNPSATYNNKVATAGMDVIFIDDVSLQVFFEYLQRLTVQTS
ncbi:unnamed protein product [Lactuca saligna]|uniref:Protein transport protein SEC23 n=1 Tax=Lactuca saligna TaxID=75948 RepID=A0AA35ZLQ9_LACSI|nr:unnamed protein product [Lactuca saligna]